MLPCTALHCCKTGSCASKERFQNCHDTHSGQHIGACRMICLANEVLRSLRNTECANLYRFDPSNFRRASRIIGEIDEPSKFPNLAEKFPNLADRKTEQLFPRAHWLDQWRWDYKRAQQSLRWNERRGTLVLDQDHQE